MRNVNWNSVDDLKEFKNPVAGGYAAKILAVEDVEKQEYLCISWDFAEGEFKGSNAEIYSSYGFYPMKIFRSYKEKALPFFKAFKTVVEETNPKYKFDNNPQSLVGKYVGVVLGEEEYIKKDGTVGTRLYVYNTCTGKRIREGDFKIPPLKKLKQEEKEAVNDFKELEEISDDDLPF